MSSCSHHDDVRPGYRGVHYIKIKAEEKRAGVRKALSQASHYCESIGRNSYYIVKENIKYVGDISEDSHKVGKKINNILGAISSNHISTESSDNSCDNSECSSHKRKIGVGGNFPSAAINEYLGEPYQINIRFKCR